MAFKISQKCADRHGRVNRLIGILLALICVLILLIAIPAFLRYKEDMERFGCYVALDKAQDLMAEEYLFNGWNLTVQEAMALVDRSRYERDQLCPGGGDYFIVRRKTSEQPFEVVCGLHDANLKERAQLCSAAALTRLLDALKRAAKKGDASPSKLTVQLNGKNLTCRRVERNPGLQFGTGTDIDRKGIVCYYAVVGDDAQRAEIEDKEGLDLSKLKEGEIWYFGYADANYASVWRYGAGWSGSAWSRY